MQEEAMRTCIRCGERNSSDFNFCSRCGADLTVTRSQKTAPGRKRPNWLLFLLVAAIFSAGYLGVDDAGQWLRRDTIQALTPPRGDDTVTRIARPPKTAPEPRLFLPPNAVQIPITFPPPKTSPTTAVGLTGPTFWPQDGHWIETEGWLVYEASQIGCFASKGFVNGLTLVLGRMNGTDDLIIGMTGNSVNLPATGDRTLTLIFDGTRNWQPYFEGHTNVVVGRYATDARLAEEIARSARLQVLREQALVAEIALDGTRAALTAISDCVRAVATRKAGVNNPRASALPGNRLCESKPLNGKLLTKRGGVKARGHKLTIRNSGQGDAVIKVRHEESGSLAYSFLVRRNEEAAIAGINDGEYRIQFAYGEVLLSNCIDYANPSASQFDESVKFNTQVKRTKTQQITYTHDFTATLYAVAGGNARTSQINPGDFLRE